MIISYVYQKCLPSLPTGKMAKNRIVHYETTRKRRSNNYAWGTTLMALRHLGSLPLSVPFSFLGFWNPSFTGPFLQKELPRLQSASASSLLLHHLSQFQIQILIFDLAILNNRSLSIIGQHFHLENACLPSLARWGGQGSGLKTDFPRSVSQLVDSFKTNKSLNWTV
ncbi:hypothetical protein CEXT_213151 [Caerostris extrusa]|uniref:Uncharacterized protein n=1 Tax=Caerostris extrusa TaxID=172846 RepID=A0AAV4PZH0_CAEEX|nr:hypothetical protein CEXT_213151 [Caerostris extrusa]